MFTFPVRVVVCRRRSSPNSMSSPRHPPVVEASTAGEDISELGASGASVAVSKTVGDFKHVWEFDKVGKLGGPDERSKCWHCGWCNSNLKGWNATKVMNHLARVPGNYDVKACHGPIPQARLALFRAFRLRKMGNKSVKRKNELAYQNSVSEGQQSLAVAWEGARVRSLVSSGSGTASCVINSADDDVVGDVTVTKAARLTTAIAEFVYCKGLSFSATEGEHFLQILRLAKLVLLSYRPPTRKVLANDLLEVCYKARLERYMSDLSVDADVYGLSLFGDGARFMGCH